MLSWLVRGCHCLLVSYLLCWLLCWLPAACASGSRVRVRWRWVTLFEPQSPKAAMEGPQRIPACRTSYGQLQQLCLPAARNNRLLRMQTQRASRWQRRRLMSARRSNPRLRRQEAAGRVPVIAEMRSTRTPSPQHRDMPASPSKPLQTSGTPTILGCVPWAACRRRMSLAMPRRAVDGPVYGSQSSCHVPGLPPLLPLDSDHCTLSGCNNCMTHMHATYPLCNAPKLGYFQTCDIPLIGK